MVDAYRICILLVWLAGALLVPDDDVGISSGCESPSDPELPPELLLFGLTYFSCNTDPVACTGICSVQDCPESSENFLVIGSGVVGVVGVGDGVADRLYFLEKVFVIDAVVGPLVAGDDVASGVVSFREDGGDSGVVSVFGGVTVSSREIGSVDVGVVLFGWFQVPCMEKVRIPVF
ncbi:hypothetical protein CTRC342_00265 [Chlamydia trachomatis RC-F(s)/342]|nr:hypothetical protein CTRC852_00265 [Chlamydia trachomatis RC-F(s)/852]AGR99032.1 hypothetical protein CTRC342_00265 [Chlamydia trachomatis RC-F(s)/342]